MKEQRRDIEEHLREKGLKLTPQRYAVMEQLTKFPTHPSADEIYTAVNERHPRASRATVYNAVAALAKVGLVSTIIDDTGVTRYEAEIGIHHHFICNLCEKILDVRVDDVAGDLSLKGPFATDSYQVVFRGLCPACKKKK